VDAGLHVNVEILALVEAIVNVAEKASMEPVVLTVNVAQIVNAEVYKNVQVLLNSERLHLISTAKDGSMDSKISN